MASLVGQASLGFVIALINAGLDSAAKRRLKINHFRKWLGD
ncbi:hypothetical protein SAMN05428997_108124 [Bosea sp. CRIB-10]|nr:hypothetical protein [Bosea sp. CRIB-10]SFC57421.1 hypothetical protein SAMN05428997_108124 [Bosea sp. CRIB-10]